MSQSNLRALSSENKLKFWQEHIRKSQAFQGAIGEYCKSADISVHTFRYWRTKINNISKMKRPPMVSRFLPIEVQAMSRSVSGPRGYRIDPIWLADFVLRLHGGGR